MRRSFSALKALFAPALRVWLATPCASARRATLAGLAMSAVSGLPVGVGGAALAAGLGGGEAAVKGKAQTAADPPDWSAQKCAFYAKAWRDLLSLSERKGISEDFIARNEAFIRSDCTDRSDICPASKEEGALVNKLTMATMNFGTASTFVPFVCRGTTGPLKMQ